MGKPAQANRPWGVTVLLALVLMFTGMQALRLWSAMSSWELLSSLVLRVPPLYFALSGALWALAGAATAYGLARPAPWGGGAAQALALSYTAFFWADRLLAQARGPQDSNWPFLATLGLLLLGSCFAILASPATKAYFMKARHRREG
ncbi:MAG: hypothetical protein KIS88_07100 [Anaerolineales bacterium]|nr:hypothetical protein [Anaerolineales bacterium]